MSNIKPDPMRAARAIIDLLRERGVPLHRIDIVQAIEPEASMSDIDTSLHWLVSMRIVKREADVTQHAGKFSGIVERSHTYHYSLMPATPQALVRAMRDTFQWLDAWSRSGGYELSRSLMLTDILVKSSEDDQGASGASTAPKSGPDPRTPHSVRKREETKANGHAQSFRHGKASAAPLGYTGDLCPCGGMLKASGGCQVCVACGSTTGCG